MIIERPVAVDVGGRRAGEPDVLTRLDAYNQQVMDDLADRSRAPDEERDE